MGIKSNSKIPPGTLADYAGTAAPPGWLVCPVAATNISRTAYAALFAAIGTTWGAGDGLTTFGMPWFAAGYAAVQANGNVGTASVGQVISHTHAYSGPQAGGYYGTGAGTHDSGVLVSGETGGAANLAAGARCLKIVKY